MNFKIPITVKLWVWMGLTIGLASAVTDADEMMLSTGQGRLLGSRKSTESGKIYYSFTNIPYAKPPVGELRFKPPVEAPNWRSIRAISFTPVCYQWVLTFGASNFYGTEDCLYLNVFTPDINETANLPVLVCIHGGEFQSGSSYQCPPNNFVEKDLVFVSMNYRLGMFGFLSTGDEHLAGNNGLKDQVAALKWVRKHITAYGGDPNKITILGQSAGGVSVHLHMYSELSKGLFHSAISQSGVALVPWSITPLQVAKNRAHTLAKLIDCGVSSTVEMLNCLKKIQARTLVELQPKFHLWNHEPYIVFTPVVEPDFIKGAFLTKDPWMEEEVYTVPWLLGFNTGEGVLKTSMFFDRSKSLMIKSEEDLDRVLSLSLSYGFTAEKGDAAEITISLKNHYFKDDNINLENIQQLINLMGDGLMKYGCTKSALRYKARKYFYLFDHSIKNSFVRILHAVSGLKHINVASHGDEFVTLFTIPGSEPEKVTFNDTRVAERMREYWINFIKTGNPNSEEDGKWKPVENEFKYLHIKTESDKMTIGPVMDDTTYRLWDNLPLRSPRIQMETAADDASSSATKDEL